MRVCYRNLFDKRPRTDHAEIRVAHHDRIRRSPLKVRELFCVDEINFCLEWRIESIFPGPEFGKNRRVSPINRVEAGSKHVGDLSLVNKNSGLRFANG